MGLMLSVLVFSVGVIEALSAIDHMWHGYLPLEYRRKTRRATLASVKPRPSVDIAWPGDLPRGEHIIKRRSGYASCSNSVDLPEPPPCPEIFAEELVEKLSERVAHSISDVVIEEEVLENSISDVGIPTTEETKNSTKEDSILPDGALGYCEVAKQLLIPEIECEFIVDKEEAKPTSQESEGNQHTDSSESIGEINVSSENAGVSTNSTEPLNARCIENEIEIEEEEEVEVGVDDEPCFNGIGPTREEVVTDYKPIIKNGLFRIRPIETEEEILEPTFVKTSPAPSQPLQLEENCTQEVVFGFEEVTPSFDSPESKVSEVHEPIIQKTEFVNVLSEPCTVQSVDAVEDISWEEEVEEESDEADIIEDLEETVEALQPAADPQRVLASETSSSENLDESVRDEPSHLKTIIRKESLKHVRDVGSTELEDEVAEDTAKSTDSPYKPTKHVSFNEDDIPDHTPSKVFHSPPPTPPPIVDFEEIEEESEGSQKVVPPLITPIQGIDNESHATDTHLLVQEAELKPEPSPEAVSAEDDSGEQEGISQFDTEYVCLEDERLEISEIERDCLETEVDSLATVENAINETNVQFGKEAHGLLEEATSTETDNSGCLGSSEEGDVSRSVRFAEDASLDRVESENVVSLESVSEFVSEVISSAEAVVKTKIDEILTETEPETVGADPDPSRTVIDSEAIDESNIKRKAFRADGPTRQAVQYLTASVEEDDGEEDDDVENVEEREEVRESPELEDVTSPNKAFWVRASDPCMPPPSEECPQDRDTSPDTSSPEYSYSDDEPA